MTLAAGTRLGPYEVVAAIGAGGMGEVYRARDTKLGREVAIKVLPAMLAQDTERLARFEREAKLLASLSHSNIAHVYGFEAATLPDGSAAHFLAMELVEGEDLAERLKRGALPADEAITIAKQIAEGLEEAHEHGIIHRDLKPANIKVTSGGKVKVLDFGLAKALENDPSSSAANPQLSHSPTMSRHMTEAGMIMGTAAYMSPEQARGKTVDKRSDIWSFGVVLFEMLTGERLFAGETVSDVLAAVLTRDLKLAGLPEATPGPVRDLLGRCLDRDVKSRLRDIGEARLALERPRLPGAPTPPPSRRARLAVAGGMIAASLVTGLAVRILTPPSTPTAPLRKLDLAAPNLDLDWNVRPVLSPDGSSVAYSADHRIWVRDFDSLEPRALTEISEPTSLSWSADSKALVFGDTKKLWSVPARGGSRVAITDIPGTGQLIGAAWSKTGRIAMAVWRGGLYEVKAGGGEAKLLLEADPQRRIDFHYPSWLDNGDLFYLIHWKDKASQGANPVLAVHDGTMEIPVPIDVGEADALPTITSDGYLLYLREGANDGLWAVAYDARGRRAAGEPFRVAPSGLSISAASNGSLLYVQRSSTDIGAELAWLDRTGKAVGTAGSRRVGLSDPTLSPDGRRIAFSAGPAGKSDIWVHDLGRGTDTRVTFGEADARAPSWLSPDRLAYFVSGTTGIRGRIMAVRADGSGQPEELASDAPMGRFFSALLATPDHRSIIQITDELGHGRLRVADFLPDGRIGPLRPFLKIQPEPDIMDARLSPDGRLLAYVTDSAQPELFLTRFPSGEGRWQVGPEAARTPRWARGTGELFFSTGPRRDSIFSARVDASLDPPLGPPVLAFRLTGPDLSSGGGSAAYDVTADGRKFLVVRPGTDAAARRMVLVENWLAEFAGKGPR